VAQGSGQDAAAQAWIAIRDTSSIAILEAFLRQFGDSVYATFAAARIDELRKTPIAASGPPVTPPPLLPAATPPANTLPPVAPPTTAAPAAPALPPDLAVQLAARDLARLRGFDANRATAIAEAMDNATSPAERNRLKAALAGRELPVTAKDLVRDWRCRTIKMGGSTLPLVIYESFRCRIAIDARGLTFRKTTGSQRTQGRLYRASDSRYLYVGASSVNDDPPVAYGTAESEDQVAWLVRPDANRLRLEFPQPFYESHFDIIELYP